MTDTNVAELVSHLLTMDQDLPVFVMDNEWGILELSLPKIREDFKVSRGSPFDGTAYEEIIKKGVIF